MTWTDIVRFISVVLANLYFVKKYNTGVLDCIIIIVLCLIWSMMEAFDWWDEQRDQ